MPRLRTPIYAGSTSTSACVELDTARPFRRSPLYDRLAAKGAVFGSKMGWERANYFARTEAERSIGYSFGPQNWLLTSISRGLPASSVIRPRSHLRVEYSS